MKIWILISCLSIFYTEHVAACECVSFKNERDEISAFVKSTAKASAIVDGTIVRDVKIFTGTRITLIQPTRILFGNRENEYILKSTSDCSRQFSKSERVKTLLLFRLKNVDVLDSILSILLFGRKPKYESPGCLVLEDAWRFAEVRQAVARRVEAPR